MGHAVYDYQHFADIQWEDVTDGRIQPVDRFGRRWGEPISISEAEALCRSLEEATRDFAPMLAAGTEDRVNGGTLARRLKYSRSRLRRAISHARHWLPRAVPVWLVYPQGSLLYAALLWRSGNHAEFPVNVEPGEWVYFPRMGWERAEREEVAARLYPRSSRNIDVQLDRQYAREGSPPPPTEKLAVTAVDRDAGTMTVGYLPEESALGEPLRPLVEVGGPGAAGPGTDGELPDLGLGRGEGLFDGLPAGQGGDGAGGDAREGDESGGDEVDDLAGGHGSTAR